MQILEPYWPQDASRLGYLLAASDVIVIALEHDPAHPGTKPGLHHEFIRVKETEGLQILEVRRKHHKPQPMVPNQVTEGNQMLLQPARPGAHAEPEHAPGLQLERRKQAGISGDRESDQAQAASLRRWRLLRRCSPCSLAPAPDPGP